MSSVSLMREKAKEYVGKKVRIVHPDNNKNLVERDYEDYEGTFFDIKEHEGKEGVCVNFNIDIFEVALDENPDDYIEAYYQEMEVIEQ